MKINDEFDIDQFLKKFSSVDKEELSKGMKVTKKIVKDGVEYEYEILMIYLDD